MFESFKSKPETEKVISFPISASQSSYGQILKSSAIVGGSSITNIALRIVRTKILALLLGPPGVGLVGVYGSICDLAESIAGMGLKSSGVRQVAESVGSQDDLQISRTIITLRRVTLILGIFGALSILALSKPIAMFSFGDARYARAIALLSLAVLFGVVSGGQTALVQGMRRIADLARLSVLGALFGTLFSIPIVYWLRENGIPLFLVLVAGMGMVSSWWYARKIQTELISIPWSDLATQASALLRLGFVFMTTAMMSLGTAYLVRVLVMRKIGVDAVGYYQAAWVLAGLYVGFILQAMGADFYPRITGVAKENALCNRMLNEQAEIGLLIAVPGILGTITFAPFVIYLFYSTDFAPTIELLRWNCLGMLLRIASWPMGFLLLAKGERGLYMLTESFANIVHVALIWFGIFVFGLVGAGMAFFGLYIFYGILMYIVVRRLAGFRWSARCQHLGLVFAPCVTFVVLTNYFLPHGWAMAIGMATTLACALYSLKILSSLNAFERIPSPIRKLFTQLNSLSGGTRV